MKYNTEILNRFLTEKVAINVETQQEWDDFMKLLENETSFLWASGTLPTGQKYWHRFQDESSIAFNFYGFERLGFSISDFYQSKSYEVIKYKYLIKEEKQ